MAGSANAGGRDAGRDTSRDAGRKAGRYVGRFAPSPTGVLHAGSMVAALASWLDARAQGGQWLVRVEDIDPPRCQPGADQLVLQQLADIGLLPDAPPIWQSSRDAAYQQALDQLKHSGWAYPCGCTRRDIALAQAARGQAQQRFEDLPYPGTCRDGLRGKPARSWRLRTAEPDGEPVLIHWLDRRLGPQQQNLNTAVGDFVLKRADGLWAYQLAVVVDDGAQGISHVVRGEDLADNSARQIHLQRLLGLATPAYLHTPLVLGPDGHKLSKQNGAQAVATQATGQALTALQAAGEALGLDRVPAPAGPAANAARSSEAPAGAIVNWLTRATSAWARRWMA